MKRTATVGIGRTILALILAFAGGVQLSLYLWDIYDDRVADPLSAAIGVAVLIAALVVALRPFRGRS